MELLELLKKRRSYRRFDQSKLISPDIQQAMKESLRYASSGMNRQQLRFMFIDNQETVARIMPFTRWAASLPPEQGQPKAGEYPTLFVAFFIPGNNTSSIPEIDAGLAYGNITLTAAYYGVGSCILHNIKRDDIGAVIHVPEGYRLHSLVGFGYATHASHIVDLPAGGEVAYYLDEHNDYCVPKRGLDELIVEDI